MPARPRKHRPLSVEREIKTRQDGKCCCGRCGGEALDGHDIEYNHRPALALREYDEDTGLYQPDENDVRYLFAEIKEHHREGTSHPRGPHTSIDSDQHAIGKVRRTKKKGLGTVDKGPKPASKWPKGRRLQSRGFEKRKE